MRAKGWAFADIAVKHSSPLTGDDSEPASLTETVMRGIADAVIGSGPETSVPVPENSVKAVTKVGDATELDGSVLVGNGVDMTNIDTLLGVADGVIVGTALKGRGVTTASVDRLRFKELLKVADEVVESPSIREWAE